MEKLKNVLLRTVACLLMAAFFVGFFSEVGSIVKEEEAEAAGIEYCKNGNHTIACYPVGAALHQHRTRDTGTARSSASQQSSRGGCYTERHHQEGSREYAGYKIYYYSLISDTTGSFDSEQGYTWHNVTYSVECIEYVYEKTPGAWGGYAYREVWRSSYTTGGGGWYNDSGPSSSFTETQDIYNETPEVTYYTPTCGKATNRYYLNNGDGAEAPCICDKTVVKLEPEAVKQTIVFGEPVNVTAVATFKDGHTAVVECNLVGFDENKFNDWQYVQLTYGDYSSNGYKNVQASPTPKSRDIQVKVLGYKTLTVKSGNTLWGSPFVEGFASNSAEVIIGQEVVANGGAKPGYYVSVWKDSHGEAITDLQGDGDLNQIKIKMPAEDYGITCEYAPHVYRVTYDPNGGAFVTGQAKYTKDLAFGSVYGSAVGVTRDGYYFNGWKVKNPDTGELSSYTVGVQDVVATAANHTLVADWIAAGPKYIYVVYDDEWGDIFQPFMRGYTFHGWFLEEYEYDQGFGYELKHDTIVKYKYTFEGRQIVKDRFAYIIYARWVPNVYNVNFVCGDNIFLDPTVEIPGANETKVVYNTIDPDRGYTSNGAVKKVTFDMLFGKFPEPILVDADGNVRTDIVFVGWSTDGTPAGLVYEDQTVDIDHDITLYAMFDLPNNVMVTLDPNGGELHPDFLNGTLANPFPVQVGKPYGSTLGFFPTWTGHTFKLWNLFEDGSSAPINTTTKVAVNTDHTLYAKWEHYVLYNANDVDIYGNPLEGFCVGGTGKNTFVNGNKTPQDVHINGYYRPNYRFIGWNTERDGSGTWYCSDTDWDNVYDTSALKVIGAELDGTITLYAQWDNSLFITFDLRGGNINGSGAYTIRTYYGKTIPNIPNEVPVKEGYIFKGYYTGIRGTGEQIYDEDGVYCYDHTGKTLHDGRVALIEQNVVHIGETYGSNLPSNAMASWSYVDKLYAKWELDPALMSGNLHFDLTLSNPDYDVDVAIPSTETVTVTGTIPKYVLATQYNGTFQFFDITIPIIIQYEDPDTEETIRINPTGEDAVDIVYVRSLDELYSFYVRALRVRAYDKSGENCLNEVYNTVYYDTTTSTVPSDISDAAFKSIVHVNGTVDEVDTSLNDTYTAEYEFIMSNNESAFCTAADDIVIVHTPVAMNVTGGSVDSGDGSGQVILNELTKAFTVTPVNRYQHINAKGYGLNDYIYSATSRLMLVSLRDALNNEDYLGNIVAFVFDVWMDVTGDGLSADDIYYPAGANIPIGLGRTFYVPSSTNIGAQSIAFASVPVNTTSDVVFRLVSGELRLADTAKTEQYVNKTVDDPGTDSAEATYNAYAAGRFKFLSSINGMEPYFTNCNYDDNTLTLNDYADVLGITPPANSIVLKMGYDVDFKILTSGGFITDNAALKIVPKYELVDESFNVVDTNPGLFFSNWVDGTKQYVVNVMNDAEEKTFTVTSSRLAVPLSLLNQSNDLFPGLLPADNSKISQRYTYTETRLSMLARLINPLGNPLPLPHGMAANDLRRSQQAWYWLFRLPSDTKVVRSGSEFMTWDAAKQTSEVIYGWDNWERSGYLKVTYTVTGYDDLYGTTQNGEPWSEIVYNPTFTVYYDLDASMSDDYAPGGIVTH